VLPALRKFREFVNATYLPGARETIGMSALPDGEAWYALDAHSSTTTDLTPKEIHEIGEREVARIEEEMAALRKALGFKGDKKAFGEFLRKDPQFYYTSGDELLAAYRDICKRIDPELPRFFGRLPRLTYGVKPVPDYAADAKPTAYYEPGSAEAGRAGAFFANTMHLDQRPKWQMEVLALHEAVPGHHLQIALAQELDEKPELLRERSYTAFIEGWALYCEGLGKEMGCYSDPYSDYGRLNFEIWRAVRLVVDTGIHAFGWSRQQAIDYFREHTAMSDYNIKVEVDRYIVWPGQALAYKIGQLKISDLRKRAEVALGTRFDIRGFHDAVLGQGAVPLDVLEKQVDDWIAREKAAKSSASAQPSKP
jgi:prolyl oligopeptidase